MNEVNNKDEYKEKEEIDAYFKDVKKKSFPIGIIFIILLLTVIGSILGYYFIIDSPKNIILSILNNKFTNIAIENTKHDTISYNYSLDIDTETNNKEYIEISNIINQIAITGKLELDINEKKSFAKVNTFYKQKDLLSIDSYYQNDEYIYIKLNSLFDKVIKTKLNNISEEELNNSSDENTDTLKKTINSLTNIIFKTLNNANYKKEYTKLNDSIVKRVILTIDEKLMKDFYNRLLNDKDFIENYTKLTDISPEELKEDINNEINNLEEFTTTISLYVSIFENEFIMLEITSDKDRIIIDKENNKYNYKIYIDSIIKYQGFILIEKDVNNYEISISIEDIEEELSIEINTDLSYEYDVDISSIDTTNAIDYDSLTETDINKITANIMKNDALLNLMQDIIMQDIGILSLI